jgi:hypothetical protein
VMVDGERQAVGSLSPAHHRREVEVFLLDSTSLYFRPTQEIPTMAKPELNRRAPDFTLTDTEGQKVRLSDYKDEKKVLLVFNRGFV